MVLFHAHAINQIHKSYAFRICTVLGYAQQYWFENQQKKPRSYTPYTLSTEHTESTRSKIICTMYFIFFDKQACRTQFLIWWAWQQIILILVGQIKQKSVSFQQFLLGMLNIKYVTISVFSPTHIPNKTKLKTSVFSSLNEWCMNGLNGDNDLQHLTNMSQLCVQCLSSHSRF